MKIYLVKEMEDNCKYTIDAYVDKQKAIQNCKKRAEFMVNNCSYVGTDFKVIPVYQYITNEGDITYSSYYLFSGTPPKEADEDTLSGIAGYARVDMEYFEEGDGINSNIGYIVEEIEVKE